MVEYIYSKSMDVLRKKPLMLWGLSVMCSLLMTLAVVLGIIPLLYIFVILSLEAGMALVYLDGYRGKKVDSNQLFDGFRDFKRVSIGMGWYVLWKFIWGFVPVYGIVKSYSYRFTPYILMTEKDITPNDALKKSMKMTNGYKWNMFVSDFIVDVICFAVCLILSLLGRIPYVGVLFGVILVIFTVLIYIFVPLLLGIIKAAYYDEISRLPEGTVWQKPYAPVPPVYQGYNQMPPYQNNQQVPPSQYQQPPYSAQYNQQQNAYQQPFNQQYGQQYGQQVPPQQYQQPINNQYVQQPSQQVSGTSQNIPENQNASDNKNDSVPQTGTDTDDHIKQ
jgi:hypothetical protein